MDESILRNLDTQHRRLAELEAEVERLRAGGDAVGLPSAPTPPRRYDELTVANDALRVERGWTAIDLDAALPPALREQFAEWRVRQRLRWTLEDVVAVGLAGVVGVAAIWFDTAIDQAVRDRLNGLRQTELIKGWERDAQRMPIDYTGPGFGGAHHRVRSAGHDIGRPFEALRQIRAGEFRGFRWDHGERVEVRESRPHFVGAARYEPVANIGEALTLWGKHLAADVITKTSLPLPGWTRLYELPSRQLRTFAHEAYRDGVNVRSGLLSTLPELTTEVIARTHVHGRAMLARGSALLDPAEESFRTELLLAAHSLVGAASLGKALTLALAGPAGATAVRHVNWPVVLRAATLAARVAADARARRATGAPGWGELLRGVAAPWQLDAAAEVERSVAQWDV